jgi:uncharacterized protein (TIGR02996 family)
MNDEAAFTRALQENPADTTLRLIFADRLEESKTHLPSIPKLTPLILKVRRRGAAVCCVAARSSVMR